MCVDKPVKIKELVVIRFFCLDLDHPPISRSGKVHPKSFPFTCLSHGKGVSD